MKEKILLIFGGRSVEHDISVITALQCMKNLPENYDFLPVYIDRDGLWWVADNMGNIEIYKNFSALAKNAHKVCILSGERTLLIEKHNKFVPFCHCMAVLNCCHGGIGEDGSLQGLLKCSQIPQSSSGVLSSALCMDKAFFKDVLKSHEIQTPNFVLLEKEDANKMAKKCKFPCVVKPANLGSSVGISLCKNAEQLKEALSLAFQFDNRVLVEDEVQNLREFNCACFCFKGKYFTSMVNEVKDKGELYTFKDKYLSTGASAHETESVLARKIKALTEKVYKLLNCFGVARVDFLYDSKSKEVYVNEVNTIPGSMAFYLFKDIPFKDLISCNIEQALLQAEEDSRLVKTFDSNALQIFEDVSVVAKK